MVFLRFLISVLPAFSWRDSLMKLFAILILGSTRDFLLGLFGFLPLFRPLWSFLLTFLSLLAFSPVAGGIPAASPLHGGLRWSLPGVLYAVFYAYFSVSCPSAPPRCIGVLLAALRRFAGGFAAEFLGFALCVLALAGACAPVLAACGASLDSLMPWARSGGGRWRSAAALRDLLF